MSSGKTSDKKQHKCHVAACRSTFRTINERSLHIDKKHGRKILCHYENCGAYLRPSSLNYHLKAIHEKELAKITCRECGESVAKYNYSKHLANCAPDESQASEEELGEEAESEESEESLSSCESEDIRPQIIRCPHKDCRSYFKPSSLNRHLKSVHEQKKKQCVNCGVEISFRSLRRHIERCVNNGNKKFMCTYESCGAVFTTKQNRSAHVSDVHRSPVKCPYDECNIFLKPRNLTKHVKLIHTPKGKQKH